MRMTSFAVAACVFVVAVVVVAGAVWLLLPRGALTPTEIVRAAACGHGVPNAVDAVVSVVDVKSPDETYDLAQPDAQHNVRMDGDSLHSHGSREAQDGYPPASLATIVEGDFEYLREDDGPWRVYYRPGLITPPTCPDAKQASRAAESEPSATDTVLHALGGPTEGEYEYRGEVTLNGVRAKHYVRVGPGPASDMANAGVADPSDPTPTPLYAYLDRSYDAVWINEVGQFVRVEGTVPREGIYRQLKFRVDYSGHGEPNAITAPFAIPVITGREAFVDRPANVQLPAALNAPGAVTYSLSPALPEGLTFNPSPRTITGTPVATAELTEYTLTAAAGGLTTAQPFTLVISAKPSTLTLYVGESLNAVIDMHHSGTFTIAPPIPGLSLDVSGRAVRLSGTPTVAAPAAEHTITVTSPVETVQEIISITVEQLTEPSPTPTPTPSPMATATPTAAPLTAEAASLLRTAEDVRNGIIAAMEGGCALVHTEGRYSVFRRLPSGEVWGDPSGGVRTLIIERTPDGRTQVVASSISTTIGGSAVGGSFSDDLDLEVYLGLDQIAGMLRGAAYVGEAHFLGQSALRYEVRTERPELDAGQAETLLVRHFAKANPFIRGEDQYLVLPDGSTHLERQRYVSGFESGMCAPDDGGDEADVVTRGIAAKTEAIWNEFRAQVESGCALELSLERRDGREMGMRTERVEGRVALGRLDDFAYLAGLGAYTERLTPSPFPEGVVNALFYQGKTELNGLPAVRYERRDLHAEQEGLRDGLTVVESVLANPLLSRLTQYTLRHDGERTVEGRSALIAIRAVYCPA